MLVINWTNTSTMESSTPKKYLIQTLSNNISWKCCGRSSIVWKFVAVTCIIKIKNEIKGKEYDSVALIFGKWCLDWDKESWA